MSSPVTLPPVSIIPEELKQIQDVQTQFTILSRRYGELHFQKKIIDDEMLNIDDEMITLENKRTEIMTALQEKYGTGTINIVDGSFIPQQ